METVINTKTRKAKVLIVDNDPVSNNTAESFLSKYYQTSSVHNGLDALRELKNNHYDAVLMNINLNNPAMDGIRTTRMIRYERKFRNLKIIAITCRSSAQEWFKKEGFDAHFKKPLIEEELVKEINTELELIFYPTCEGFSFSAN